MIYEQYKEELKAAMPENFGDNRPATAYISLFSEDQAQQAKAKAKLEMVSEGGNEDVDKSIKYDDGQRPKTAYEEQDRQKLSTPAKSRSNWLSEL